MFRLISCGKILKTLYEGELKYLIPVKWTLDITDSEKIPPQAKNKKHFLINFIFYSTPFYIYDNMG